MTEEPAGARAPWQIPVATFAAQGKNSEERVRRMELHLTEVTKAVRAGKEVPQDVLEDYPDLQSKLENSEVHQNKETSD